MATAVVGHQGGHSPAAALDASPDPHRARAVMSTLSHNASGCLTGTCTCRIFISQTKPASDHQHQAVIASVRIFTPSHLDKHERKCLFFYTSINLFIEAPPVRAELCLAPQRSIVCDSSCLGSGEQGDIRGRYHGNRVAGKCLYGVRARQCYRLFCSKQ